MTKYRLKLKSSETINSQDVIKYNFSEEYLKREYLFLYSNKYALCERGSGFYNRGMTEFNGEDIDLIPSGLLKKFDVIEIEEDRYNIICPITSGILVEVQDSGKKIWMDNDYNYPYNTTMYKRCFTEQEIKENFGYYYNKEFMVKID